MLPRWATYLSLGLIAASAAVSWYLYPQLHAVMAMHWNFRGDVNGTMPKIVGAYLMPGIALCLLALLSWLPLTDPFRENVRAFRHVYGALVSVIVAALTVIHVGALLINIGVPLSPEALVLVTIGLMFAGIGFILPYVKRNWFIGIRTPWTLSSDDIWNRTHRVSGVVFQFLGVFAILCGFAPVPFVFVFFMAAVCTGFLGIVAYSYALYRQAQ